ncbi:MAG: molybdopterin-dependent oxidoreductase [Anaerolineae bacterium]|nr:molybdopterin-dependent oxidoreductase [Anaerolineae bacterium]
MLDDTVLTRRSFMKWSTALGSTAALAGGLQAVAGDATPTVKAAGETKLMTTGCYHNCGGRCILYAEVQDGVVKRILPDQDPEDSFDQPRAIPCVRGRSQYYRVYSPERLKYPMKRVGKRGEGKFERISWEEALDTIATEIKRIKETYGNEAIHMLYATGVNWNGCDGDAPISRTLALYGGFTSYYGNYSAACYIAALPHITSLNTNSADDLLNSKLAVLIGVNACVTRTGGDGIGYHYLEAKRQGTRFISIDPIYTETAAVLDAEWIPIYPGTDVALIAAMAYVMVKEDLYDKEFMAKYVVGFDEDTLPEGAPKNSSYIAYLMGDEDGVEKTPEWAAEITGIPSQRIISLAREIAQVKPCALIQSYGVQRRAYGEQPIRALPVLAAMSGNFGIAGGGAGTWHGAGTSLSMGSFPVPENPVKALISVYMWPDMIERGAEMTSGSRDKVKGVDKLSTNLKMIWNHGGNCITNQHSDVNGTIKMLEDESKCEFIVTAEVMMTPSCAVSDILLPSTSGFESDNINVGRGFGRSNWTMYSHAVIEPMYEARTDLWVAEQIAERLGILDAFQDGHTTREDWLREIVAVAQEKQEDFPSFEEFREKGVYKIKGKGGFIAGKAFVEDPEANPLKTESGKIQVYSPALAAWNEPEEIPALPKYIPEWEGVSDPLREKYPLLMIGTHAMQRSHSTFNGVAILEEAHQHVMLISPVDAEARGIKNGDMVKVFNDRGVIEIKARVTPRIRPGVINVYQGHWHKPDAKGVDKGGCVNTLTKYHPTPLAKGNPQHTNLAQVEKL